jgi:hypothetical protein
MVLLYNQLFIEKELLQTFDMKLLWKFCDEMRNNCLQFHCNYFQLYGKSIRIIISNLNQPEYFISYQQTTTRQCRTLVDG